MRRRPNSSARWPKANCVSTPATKNVAITMPIKGGVPSRCSKKSGSSGSPRVAPIHWMATMTVRRRKVCCALPSAMTTTLLSQARALKVTALDRVALNQHEYPEEHVDVGHECSRVFVAPRHDVCAKEGNPHCEIVTAERQRDGEGRDRAPAKLLAGRRAMTPGVQRKPKGRHRK